MANYRSEQPLPLWYSQAEEFDCRIYHPDDFADSRGHMVLMNQGRFADVLYFGIFTKEKNNANSHVLIGFLSLRPWLVMAESGAFCISLYGIFNGSTLLKHGHIFAVK